MNKPDFNHLVVESKNDSQYPLKRMKYPIYDRQNLQSLDRVDSSLDKATEEQQAALARIYAEQAAIYSQEGNWQDAIAACQKALQISPKTAEAYKVLGNIMQRTGKKGKALGYYAKALEINPNLAEVYANLGSFYAEQEKWEQAIDYYQQALKIKPNFAGVYRSLALIWEEIGNTKQALECLCQAVKLNSKILTPEDYFLFGNRLYKAKKLKEASIFYTQGVKLKPNAPQELNKLVEILETIGEWQAAATYYQQLINLKTGKINARELALANRPIKHLFTKSARATKSLPPAREKNRVNLLARAKQPVGATAKNLKAIAPTNTPPDKVKPESAVSWNNLGSLYAKKQQWRKAISCYQEAIQLDANFGKTYRNLARVYAKIGQKGKAADCWYEGFSLEPNSASAEEHFYLGKSLWEQQKPERAIACFRRSIQLKPEFSSACLALGSIFKNQQKLEESKTCYLQIVKHDPHNFQAYFCLAQIATERESWTEAIEFYQKAIIIEPKHWEANYYLAEAFSKKEQWQFAVDAYEKAIALRTDFSWAYHNLAYALQQQEKWQPAVAAYEKAIALKADFFWSYYNLGDTFSKLFQWEKAIAAYGKAIELKPDASEARAHLADAFVRLEKWDDAIACYRQAIEIYPGSDKQVYQNLAEALERQKKVTEAVAISSATIAQEKQAWPFVPITVYAPPATLPDGSPWPKISIVTPSFNQGEFIEETILSVIGQNYPNVEYISIDGGSTDRTQEIIDKYRDSFAYAISEPDRGQSDALNKGFKQATGEIFTWLNSDDRLAPGALYAVALAFHTSKADVVAGVCQIFRDGEEIERHLTSCTNGAISLEEILDLENCWLQGKFFYQPEVMFTRAIWEKAGGEVKESLYYSMDYEMWARFAANGAKIQTIGFPIAQYRMHEGQKTSSMDKYQPELVKTRDLLRQEFNLPHTQVADNTPTKKRRHLRVVCLNDTGFLGGAGIAHERIARALSLAGHEVTFVAGTLDWSQTPVDCTAEEVAGIVSTLNPDLLVLGNIHNFQFDVEILDKLSSQLPIIFVMHDQWLFTGRCGYTSGCESYRNLCDAECPTWNEYPILDAEKISDAFHKKQSIVRDRDNLLLLGDSQWLTNWARYAYLDRASEKSYRELERKFHTLYYGLDTEIFTPRDTRQSRRQLGLPEDKFIILTGSQSLDDSRKGFKYLLEALKIANLENILVLCFGHDAHLETTLDIKSIGYINSPVLLSHYYSAADLFISPAQEEAFGQTFIEATACGTPAIGYETGGVAEAICNRVSGRTVKQKTAGALAETIGELYRDREQLKLLSEIAPWYVANNFTFASSYHTFINALDNSGWLSNLGMSAVTKFAVDRNADIKFVAVKGGNPKLEQTSIPNSQLSNKREILMDESLQGSGWFSAEKLNDLSVRWMKKIGTIIVDPIDILAKQFQLEIFGIMSVDPQLIDSMIVTVNGNPISMNSRQENGFWVSKGDFSAELLIPESSFLITIETTDVRQLSAKDSREGSLLVRSILIQ